YLKERVPEHDLVITDMGSGLNMRRKGFRRLLKMMLNNEVSKIVVAHQDRLVRFGFEILEEVCRAHGCEIVVLEKEDPEQELIEDLISILVSFSGGTRGHEREKVKKCVEELKN
ncbi:IS607 family transposase, partial [Metallosphaera javensis (ex Hofmann et al. 2022)]|uniref:IS607 family transposase n=1 Tax=Metallosphaera javensis (ex Hofmann et al. 2022) TaxID=99938 RepID=UPI001EDD2F9C